ncbi:MAG TPA: RGCVC family protein [Pseudonocardia sp.]|jgi:hypothetical protein
MTVEVDGRSTEAAPTDDSPPERACEACGHDVSAHDATSGRFCRATVDRELDRGCICPSDEAATTAASRQAGRGGAPMYGRGRFSGK